MPIALPERPDGVTARPGRRAHRQAPRHGNISSHSSPWHFRSSQFGLCKFSSVSFHRRISSMALILHAGNSTENAAKVLITAEYVGVVISLAAEFRTGETSTTPLNPSGKDPVLETPDGNVWESNAITRYVAKLKDSTLLGNTIYEAALVDQWIDFSDIKIRSNLQEWLAPTLANGHFSAEIEKATIEHLKDGLEILSDFLASRTFLVGNSITLADISVACNLAAGYRTVFSKEFTAGYPHVDRYFWTLANQPEFKTVFGEIVLGSGTLPASHLGAEKPAVGPKGGGTPKSKKAPKPKKAQEPKEAPNPQEVVADEEEEEAPKPKVKNALDLLPPSPFVLDNWKRLYSNTKAKDFAEVAIKGFWEMYDPEGWSLWFSDYKYNEENDKTYVTMNRVGGFLQRLDFIRKYAFGKVLILGENPPYKIKGVWLFRGPEIPKQVVDECYDVELYTWTKADLSSEEQKARISAYFEEPDYVDGEKLLEAKCFK